MKTYTKADVEFHSDGFRPSRPAVRVKHWPDFERDVDWSEFEAEFHDWALAELERPGVFEVAWEVGCENCWDLVQADADECFRETAPNGNYFVKVWSQGRSGGWAVVDGLKDFESWDAIDLAAWRKFERQAKEDARDLAYQMVSFLYLNR